MSSLITFRKDYPALSSWALCNQCSEYFNVEKEGRKISVAVMYFGKGYINFLTLDLLFLGSLTLTLFPCPGSLSPTSRHVGREEARMVVVLWHPSTSRQPGCSTAQQSLHRAFFISGKRWVPADLKDLRDVHGLHVGQDTIWTCVDVVSGVFWEICVTDGSWGPGVCVG